MSDIHALSGAYAVDALDDLERAAFERHLADCADCRAEVAEPARGRRAARRDHAPPSRRPSCATGCSPASPPSGRCRPRRSHAPATQPTRRHRRPPRLLVAPPRPPCSLGGRRRRVCSSRGRRRDLPGTERPSRCSTPPTPAATSLDFPGGATRHGDALRLRRSRAVHHDHGHAGAAGRARSTSSGCDQPDDGMVPAGVMPATAGPDGACSAATPRPRPAAGITVEPDGGSPEPTTEPIALFDFARPRVTREVAVVGSGVAGPDGGLRRLAHAPTSPSSRPTTGSAGTPTPTWSTTGPAALAIDTGFIVHNPRTYPVLLRLFAELGVVTQASEMSMSIRDDDTGLEWAGALGPRGPLPERAQPGNPAYLRMLAEIPRFHRAARRAGRQTAPTLREFLDAARVLGVLPRGTSWSRWSRRSGRATRRSRSTTRPATCSRSSSTTGCSASSAARVAHRHRRLARVRRPGRAPRLQEVRARHQGHLGARDRRRRRGHRRQRRGGDVRRRRRRHPPRPGAGDAGRARRPRSARCSARSATRPNIALLHTDTSLLPSAPGARASWNFRRPVDDRGHVTVTYDLTRLQRLDTEHPLPRHARRRGPRRPRAGASTGWSTSTRSTTPPRSPRRRGCPRSTPTGSPSPAPTTAGASTRTAPARAWPRPSGSACSWDAAAGARPPASTRRRSGTPDARRSGAPSRTARTPGWSTSTTCPTTACWAGSRRATTSATRAARSATTSRRSSPSTTSTSAPARSCWPRTPARSATASTRSACSGAVPGARPPARGRRGAQHLRRPARLPRAPRRRGSRDGPEGDVRLAVPRHRRHLRPRRPRPATDDLLVVGHPDHRRRRPVQRVARPAPARRTARCAPPPPRSAVRC